MAKMWKRLAGLVALLLLPVATADAQWAHCEVYRTRAYQAAQASNLAQVEIEQNRYYACVNGVPTPQGPRNRPQRQPQYFESTLEDMSARNHYCGSSNGQYFFCSKDKRCDPNQLGRCIAPARRAASRQAFVPKRGRVCNTDAQGRTRCVNKRYR